MSDNKNRMIQALISSGADAQKNMYDVYITFPGSESQQLMTVRAGGFSIPEAETPTEDRKYHGITLPTPKTEVNFDRKFTLTFRMDAQYNLLEKMNQWHSYTTNAVTGGMSNWMPATGEVQVKTINATTQNGAFTARGKDDNYVGYNDVFDSDTGGISTSSTNTDVKTWYFYDVWPSKVGEPKFERDSGGSFTFDVTFNFGDCDYPDLGAVDTTASNS